MIMSPEIARPKSMRPSPPAEVVPPQQKKIIYVPISVPTDATRHYDSSHKTIIPPPLPVKSRRASKKSLPILSLTPSY